MKTYGWFFVFLVLLTGLCFAAEQAAQVPAAPADVAAAPSVWTGILKGILAGGVAAVVGYMAQNKLPDGTHEPFDVAQFAVTLVIGAGFGAYAGWKNLAIADVENLPIVASVVAGIELVLKTIWRNLKVSVSGALTAVQAGNPTQAAPAALPSTASPAAAGAPKTS